MLAADIAAAERRSRDVTVIGAGPVGMALALALDEAGLAVLLVETGGEAPEPAAAALSAGHGVDLARHAAPDLAICRALGGASHWWGGRCVPLDPIDFEPRPHLPEAAWPITHADLARWHRPAADFFGLGADRFAETPAVATDAVETGTLERWAPVPALGAVHGPRLAASNRVTLLTGTTLTGLHLSADRERVEKLDLVGPRGAARRMAARGAVVLACGGLETTRLLLAAQASDPRLFGGPGGALGRYYMGHLSGRIADIVLDDPTAAAGHDFFVDAGVYVRRRLTLPAAVQRRESLLNIAFWLDNPTFHAAGHGNGVLSLVWLALACRPLGRRLVSEALRVSHVGPAPVRPWPHLRNALRRPLATARSLLAILAARYLARLRRPGFLLRTGDGRYALHYHAEQAPRPGSHLRLSGRRDPLGLPYLDVGLDFDEADARSVVRAHELLDEALRRNGQGRLVYHHGPGDRLGSVLTQARDGFHQIGTARMGRDPRRSVVDPDCRVHGLDNLFVASSAVFPSSGQANPTFAAVGLALRLADHLAQGAAGAGARRAREGEALDPAAPVPS